MENHYVECAKCKRYFDQGTIGKDFAGFGRRTAIPQRRWHSASEVKTYRFVMQEHLCHECGGMKIEPKYKVQVHKEACAAWKDVPANSELAALMPKYLRKN